MSWQPIETAPQDGTRVEAGRPGLNGWIWYPLESRFLHGKWCANFDQDDWRPYDPQPTLWRPVSEPAITFEAS